MRRTRKIKIKKLKDIDNRVYDNCPKCGWDAPNFDGTFYRVVGIEIQFDLDPNETEIPEKYYPKISNKKPMPPVMGMYFGNQWEEIHLCPLCNTEFTFINSDH